MSKVNEQAFALLEKTGLNWTVNKEPLFSKDGKETQSHGIFRNDTKEWIGTVGNRYETFQNFEMAEMVVKASDGLDLQVTRGGELYGGQKTYLQIELPQMVIGNSPVKRWLSCLNSHDGSSSIGFGSANTTVICSNTFFRAMGELDKIRHTASAHERVATMVKDIRIAMGMDNDLMTTFKRMADLPLQDEIVERVIRKLFSVEAKTTASSDISTRKGNQIKAFADALKTSVGEQGSTVWALFNGVTRYTNHFASPSNEDKKMDFLMANGGSVFNNKGYDEVMAWVTKHTAQLVPVTR